MFGACGFVHGFWHVLYILTSLNVELGSCANTGDFRFESSVPTSKHRRWGTEHKARGVAQSSVCCSEMILCNLGQGFRVALNYSFTP